MKLEFHPETEMELIEAAAHYEFQVPGLGKRFEAELRRATEILLEHPAIGAPADPDLRRFILNRFSFTPYYSATSDVFRRLNPNYALEVGRSSSADQRNC